MKEDQESRKRWLKAWLVVEVVALLTAFLSTGGGHGQYVFARLLFPIPMYIGLSLKSLAGAPTILALIQYPAVGLLPFCLSWRQTKWLCVFFAVVHAVFTFMAFSHPSTQFGG